MLLFLVFLDAGLYCGLSGKFGLFWVGGGDLDFDWADVGVDSTGVLGLGGNIGDMDRSLGLSGVYSNLLLGFGSFAD